jgi:hypothetical protein
MWLPMAAIFVAGLLLGVIIMSGITSNDRRVAEATRSVLRFEVSYRESFELLISLLKKPGVERLLAFPCLRQALDLAGSVSDYKELYELVSRSGTHAMKELALKEWNDHWQQAAFGASERSYRPLESQLELLALSNPENPYLEDLLRQMIYGEEARSPERSYGYFAEISKHAKYFPSMRVQAFTQAAIEAEKPEQVEQLIGYMKAECLPFGACTLETEEMLHLRLVELEPRIGKLLSIANDRGFSARSGAAAFEKLRTMPNPSFETSSTYGAS